MAFEEPRGLRTARQREIADDGLCYAMVIVTGGFPIGKRRDHYNLIDAMNGGRNDVDGGYIFGIPISSPAGSADRATFAYLMAAMTDAERDAIVEGL